VEMCFQFSQVFWWKYSEYLHILLNEKRFLNIVNIRVF
jgi:hypothetical protein